MQDYNICSETKCGFFVSEERKKVWKKMLEMLEVFHNICEENHLKYWAMGGTLLGAIRHDGFIPWDDDIDVCMPREDYDKLVKICENGKVFPFFFQTEKTDKNYFLGNARIRNSNTTAIRKSDLSLNIHYNRGIWFSIFPFDNIPDNENDLKKHVKDVCKVKNALYLGVYGKIDSKNPLKRNIHIAMCKMYVGIVGPKRLYKKHLQLCRKYNTTETKRFGQVSTFYRRGARVAYDKHWFDETITHKFENVVINVPARYEDFLNFKFGNWHKFVVAGSAHGEMFFDTEKPYTYYENKPELLSEIFADYSL